MDFVEIYFFSTFFFVLGWETHEVKLQCILLYYVPRKKFLDIFQICWLDLENPPDLIKSSIYNRWEAISPHTNDLSKNYNLQFEFWWSFYTEWRSEVVGTVEHFQGEIVFSSKSKKLSQFSMNCWDKAVILISWPLKRILSDTAQLSTTTSTAHEIFRK